MATSGVRTCPQCGTVAGDWRARCNKCGHVFPDVVDASVPKPERPPSPAPKAKKSRWSLVGWSLVVLVVGAWVLSEVGEPFHLTVGAVLVMVWAYYSLSARLARIEAAIAELSDRL